MLMSLWMYGFRYFYHPSVLLAIMLIGTAISVGLTFRQRQMLFKLFTQASLVPYVRKGYVKATTSQRLLPGDVIVVQQGLAVCDMVLLRGNCLVEASKLSGEVKDQHCQMPSSACDVVQLGVMRALPLDSFASRFRICSVYGVLHVRQDSITGSVAPVNLPERGCIMLESCTCNRVCRLSKCVKTPMFQTLSPMSSLTLISTAPQPYWQDLSFTRCVPA